MSSIVMKIDVCSTRVDTPSQTKKCLAVCLSLSSLLPRSSGSNGDFSAALPARALGSILAMRLPLLECIPEFDCLDMLILGRDKYILAPAIPGGAMGPAPVDAAMIGDETCPKPFGPVGVAER